MSKATIEQYLGDGVYASFDGYTITLDLRAQGPEKIVLEPEVIRALLDFTKYVGLLTETKGKT